MLQALVDSGPLSRADLAKMAGVTRATIGGIIQSLTDAGILEEGPPLHSAQVGKPARPLWFTPRAGLTAAAAIRSGRFEVALVNARGEILEHAERSFRPRAVDGAGLGGLLVTALREVLPRSRRQVLGIGIALPGICDTAGGEVVASGQLPRVHGPVLVDTIRDAFGVEVLVDNDSRAQALGEKWFGKGRGRATFASVQTGAGLGVGLVLDGLVYRGHGAAGEMGHTCVVLDGGRRCRCGLWGCWETVATLGWLRDEAERRDLPGSAKLDALGLVRLAARGIPEAAALLDTYADHLALGLANLNQLLEVGLFILHGDAASGGEPFRECVETRTRERVFALLGPEVSVELSELDQRAGLLGAAGVVLSHTFNLAV